MAATVVTINVDANPYTAGYLPNHTGGIVVGNQLAYPVYVIKNTHANTIAANTLKIWNYTNGAYLCIASSLAQNKYLKIDAATGISYTSDDGVTYTAATNVAYGKAPFLPLTPGVENRLIIIGMTTGVVTVTYVGRYI